MRNHLLSLMVKSKLPDNLISEHSLIIVSQLSQILQWLLRLPPHFHRQENHCFVLSSMKIKAVTIIDTHMVLVGVIDHVKTCNDWVFFRSRQDFQFEKSSFECWLKSKKKKKVIGEYVLILDWRNSKYFVGQLSEMKFCVTPTIQQKIYQDHKKLKFSGNEKRKQKMKNEKIKN